MAEAHRLLYRRDWSFVFVGGRTSLQILERTFRRADNGAEKFVTDSPLEGDGFELPVPGRETVKTSWKTGLLY